MHWFTQAAAISVMTFNIENGGTQIDFNKVVEAVRKSGADVVGVQEAWGNTQRLAQALGWKYYDSRQHIVSRLPLLEPVNSHGRYVYIEVKPRYVVAMANVHLPDEPYGPDLVKKGMSAKVVEDNERAVRLPTAAPYIQALSALAKHQVPVFLTGDFNSPSHLDWTSAHVDKMQNHRYAVTWAVSAWAVQQGLVDSFRAVHPDPLIHPGLTWPSGRPVALHSVDGFNPSKTDLADRIDVIYTGGPSRVLDSHVVDETSLSPWPSDHRAVVSRFDVTPKQMPERLFARPIHSPSPATPRVQASKQTFHRGEPITITWNDAPGNRYDYVQITPIFTSWHDAARFYTQANPRGLLQVNADNTQGNWPAWNKAAVKHWPLPPGLYEVRLMLDDSNHVLAATKIKIS